MRSADFCSCPKPLRRFKMFKYTTRSNRISSNYRLLLEASDLFNKPIEGAKKVIHRQ